MRNESFQKRRALKTAFYGENVIFELVDRLVGNRHNTFASGISVGFRTMRNESFQKRRALKTAFYGENVIFVYFDPILA